MSQPPEQRGSSGKRLGDVFDDIARFQKAVFASVSTCMSFEALD
jgi:hypothetical protein